MSDGERLLTYCNAYPDDDLAHRAYADWLEEQGDDARAEFVRLQLDRSALWDGHPDDEDLWDRDRALVAKHGAAWRAELPAWVRDSASFSRGLLTHFELDGWKLLTADPESRGFAMLGLRLRASPGELADIAAGGFLRGVRSLTLLEDLDPSNALELAKGARLAGLRRLAFRTAVSPATLAALLPAPALRDLEVLHLAFPSEGLAALLAAPEVAFRLRRLRIEYLGAATDLRVLTTAPSCAGLEELTLSSVSLGGRASKRPPPPAFPRLRLLDFSRSRARAATLLRQLRALGRCRPERLRFAGSRIEGAAVAGVLGGFDLDRLEELDLSANTLGDDGWAALCRIPMPSLRFLNGERTGLTDACLDALSRAPWLGGLRQLRLGGDRGVRSDEAFCSLLSAPALRHLEALSCPGLGLGPEVVGAIASSPHLAALRELRLGQNGMGPASARALADSTTLPALRRLDLSSTSIGPEGAEALLDSPLMDRLVRLDVASNGLCPELRDRFRARAGDRPWQI